MGQNRKVDIYDGESSVIPICGRYGTPEMCALYSDEKTLEYKLRVEAKVVEVISRLYPEMLPKELADEIVEMATTEHVFYEDVIEVEKRTHHDIMALIHVIESKCSDKAKPFIHLFLTSADVTETAKALQIKDSWKILRRRLLILLKTLCEKAIEWQEIVCIGRTHGQFAVPETFGRWSAYYATEIGTFIRELHSVIDQIPGKIAGATGNYHAAESVGIDAIKLESVILNDLDLAQCPMSTQVPSRIMHTQMISLMGSLASMLSNVAQRIWTLKRGEISELLEPADKGQVGSSTMPQKNVRGGNPFIEERIRSIARELRSKVAVALESIEMDYSRDLSASLTDRILYAETFILLEYSAELLNNLMKRVIPDKIAIWENLGKAGFVTAEKIMTALVLKGYSRTATHKLLRDVAQAIQEDGISVITRAKDRFPILYKEFSNTELMTIMDTTLYTGESKTLIRNTVKTLNDEFNLEISNA